MISAHMQLQGYLYHRTPISSPLRRPLLSLGLCRCLLGKKNACLFRGNPAAAVHNDLAPWLSIMAACLQYSPIGSFLGYSQSQAVPTGHPNFYI